MCEQHNILQATFAYKTLFATQLYILVSEFVKRVFLLSLVIMMR